MRRRKLLIGLMSAGAFTAGFGAAVFPASAQLRTITVTLLGGQTVRVRVDEPAEGGSGPPDTSPAVPTPVAGVTADPPAPPPTDTGTSSSPSESPAPADTSSSPTPAPAADTPTTATSPSTPSDSSPGT